MRTIHTNEPDGNANYILGLVTSLARERGDSEEKVVMILTRMRNSDYKNLCKIAMEEFPDNIKILEERV